LAKEFQNLGKLEESIEQFNSLIKLNPNYTGTYYHLANSYIELELLEKAKETYLAGIEICKSQNAQHDLAELQNAYQNFLIEFS
ncbi:MAG: tetratricopeptide repeat protein, partial [Bacteroidota bacterium]